MQRKLKFYLSREKHTFKLHVLQIDAGNKGDLGNKLVHVDPMIMQLFFRRNNIFDFIFNYFSRFNNLSSGGDEFHSLFKIYSCPESIVREAVVDKCDRNAEYDYHLRGYMLPVKTNDLLKFLGVLDSAVQAMLRECHKYNEVTGIEYCDQLPDFSQKSDICHRTLEPDNKVPLLPKKHLSRHIAEWMIDQLSLDLDDTADFQPLLECLTEMLDKEAGSLTPAIRQYLYPDPSVEKVLNEYCQGANELTLQLLNPVLPLTERTNSLLGFIKTELKKKPVIKTEEPLDTAEEMKAKQKQIADIHAEIADWFETYDRFRKIVWSKQIENLYGKLADDGGYYSDNYTEVKLLRDAKLVRKTNGLIQLHFLHTVSYKTNYAPGRYLHDKLETELRAACGDLDLHFLPDQDFHQQVVFDGPSSKRLEERGYHFSAQFCKDQLRTELNKRHFMFSANAGCINPFTKLGRDVKGLLLLWINQGYRDRPAEVKEVKDLTGAVRLMGRFIH